MPECGKWEEVFCFAQWFFPRGYPRGGIKAIIPWQPSDTLICVTCY